MSSAAQGGTALSHGIAVVTHDDEYVEVGGVNLIHVQRVSAPVALVNGLESERMAELIVDFITSLDGYASAEGWPGWWGLEGPEYLAWLEQLPDRTYTTLMGATTYRVMSGFAAATQSPGSDETAETGALDELTRQRKVVFSSTLEAPLTWANTELVSSDAVETVANMKRGGENMRTLGSLALCRSLLEAGLVDRFRLCVFPVITGKTGRERVYDGYPDVALEMISSRTFDGRIQMLEYVPTVLGGVPGANTSA